MPQPDLPRISCLMVSRGALFPAHFAVECYRRQTYANRELVVVTSNRDGRLKAWVEALGDPTIRFIEAEDAPLGTLRNISVTAAQGDLLAIWDDDDLYDAERLEVQQRLLAEDPEAAAHFIAQVLTWWPARRTLWLSHIRPWEGTMLVKRDLLPEYPALARAEDTPVIEAIYGRHRIATHAAARLYCYVIHGGNCSEESLFESNERKAKMRVRGSRYANSLAIFAEKLPMRDYARELAQALGAASQDGRPLLDEAGPAS